MKNKKCLILSDGKMGHQNQSVKLAENLGLKKYNILTLKRRKTFGKILSYINPIAITSEADVLDVAIKQEKYDVVIGGGSVPRLAMLWIKKKYPHIKTVCLMDPKRCYESYDAIAAPSHDSIKYKGDNIVRHTGSLSGFTEEDLSQATEKFKAEFSKFKKPLIGLIVGGGSKGYDFTEEKAEKLISSTLELNKKIGGYIYATTSGRTGATQSDYIYNSLTKKGFSVYKGEGENPYRGMMAYSDIIIVTPETISMLTEACSSNAIVLVFDRDSVSSNRIKKFTSEMVERKLAFDMDKFLLEENIKIDKKTDSFIEKELERVVNFIKEKI